MNTEPRTIGPVTTAAGGGVAAATVLCWLISLLWNVTVPTDVQGAISLLFVILAGAAVRPRTNAKREHAA